MPVLAQVIRRLFKRRVAINKITDQRVTLTQEILQAVRFVKFFGWETAFLDRIYAIRKREIRSIQQLLTLRNAINAVSMSMPVFASMLAFITYSLSKHVLNPAPIFSSLALFNALRMPLVFLPLVLGQVVDALASIRRIQEFLMEEEAADDFDWDFENKNAIVVEHANFTWERTPTQDPENAPGKDAKSYKQMKQDKKAEKKSAKEAKKADKRENKQGKEVKEGKNDIESDQSTLTEQEIFKLWDMDFSISRNELIAVIGTVGSGKSSLLAALAGDMRKTSGTIKMGASRAFCPQYAWIQNATAKENIMFGKLFRRDWYDKVVEACALLPDFEMLPNGDLTEIGERGITVSGGQKQRLNIARAIYFDTDIVLLDDPLSAVDAHVGRQIMDKAICGLLKDKCRILATHQLWVLNRCDRIIWMEGGRIQAIDTFDNLIANNDEFVRLMKTTAVEEKEGEEKHDEIGEEKKGQDKGKGKKRGSALMTIEEKQVESVKWSVYGAYVKAGGGYWIVPLVGVLLVSTQISNIITSLWLSWWTSDEFKLNEGSYVSLTHDLEVSNNILTLNRLPSMPALA
jgi:ABC-type multidrug transport system fused ATPase/permease subunit